MADNLKVFTNRVLTGNDATGDLIPIVSTESDTQAVITDVQFGDITSDAVKKSTLVLGVATIATALTNMKGTQSMDNSEVLNIKLPSSVDGVKYTDNLVVPAFSAGGTQVSTSGIASSNTGYETTSEFLAKNPTVGLPAKSVKQTTPSASFSWIVLTPPNAYYFTYDGNSTTQLYRASYDGVNFGSFGAVETSSYAYKCFNPVNKKIYWSHSGLLHELDCITNLPRTVTTDMDSTSTYSRSAVCGDYFFCNPASNASVLNIVKISTGEKLPNPTISNLNIAGGNASFAVVKTDTHYILYTSLSGVVRGHSVPIADLEAGGQVTFTQEPNDRSFLHSSNGPMAGDDKGNLYYRNTGSKLAVARMSRGDTANPVPFYVSEDPLNSDSGVQAGELLLGADLTPDQLDINIPCRISGIEVTGE